MLKNIRNISNPLTIIAIFAGLAEVSATIALGLVDKSLQAQFIWFVMLFPVFLVTLFFMTLNFNHRVLYSPGDFSDEANFMELLRRQTIERLTQVESSIAQDEAIRGGPMKFTRGNVVEQMRSVITKEDYEEFERLGVLSRMKKAGLELRPPPVSG